MYFLLIFIKRQLSFDFLNPFIIIYLISSKLPVSKGGSGLNMKKLLVAAIEIGNASSCYAFSFRHDYERDPSKISVHQWKPYGGPATINTPTAVLFDVNKLFYAFGYEAEYKYTDLQEEYEHTKWYYFRRFMLTLQDEKVRKNSL